MVETILSSPLAQTAFVFLLVFTLVFAILQKTKILGDGKHQIDALVALAIGLIIISVGYALDIIHRLIPFLAIGLVVILVFLLLFGSVYQPGEFKLNNWVKAVFGVIIFAALVITVLIITGGGDYILDWFYSADSSFLSNAILIIIIIAVVVLAFVFGGRGESGKGKSS